MHTFTPTTDNRNQTAAACTCGWRTAWAHYGDQGFIQGVTAHDYNAHLDEIGSDAPRESTWVRPDSKWW